MRHEKYRKNKRNRTYTGGEKTMKLGAFPAEEGWR